MPGDVRWLTFEDVCAAHEYGLKGRPGAAGIANEGYIHSAVAAPQNLYEHDNVDDILVLAIRYCGRIASNHGFVDGNKRAAALSMTYFLEINGFHLRISDGPDFAGETRLSKWVKALAAHEITEDQLYEYLEEHVEQIAFDLNATLSVEMVTAASLAALAASDNTLGVPTWSLYPPGTITMNILGNGENTDDD